MIEKHLQIILNMLTYLNVKWDLTTLFWWGFISRFVDPTFGVKLDRLATMTTACGCEILHQLVDGLSHYDPMIYGVELCYQ